MDDPKLKIGLHEEQVDFLEVPTEGIRTPQPELGRGIIENSGGGRIRRGEGMQGVRRRHSTEGGDIHGATDRLSLRGIRDTLGAEEQRHEGQIAPPVEKNFGVMLWEKRNSQSWAEKKADANEFLKTQPLNIRIGARAETAATKFNNLLANAMDYMLVRAGLMSQEKADQRAKDGEEDYQSEFVASDVGRQLGAEKEKIDRQQQ